MIGAGAKVAPFASLGHLVYRGCYDSCGVRGAGSGRCSGLRTGRSDAQVGGLAIRRHDGSVGRLAVLVLEGEAAGTPNKGIARSEDAEGCAALPFWGCLLYTSDAAD